MRGQLTSIGAAFALLVALQSPAQPMSVHSGTADATVSGGEAGIWSLLLPPAAKGAPDTKAIAERIAREGPAALEPIIAILMGESTEPEVSFDVHPRAIEERHRILLDSLRRLPPNQAIDGLRSRITERTSVDMRVQVIQILAEIGGVRAFEGVMGIATALDPIQWRRTFVQVPIEDSLVKLVAKSPRLARLLEQVLDGADPGFAPIVVRALCAARVPTALRALPRCLGRDAELDLCVLESLAKIGARFDPAADPEGTKRLRAQLDHQDATVRRAAAVVLARIGDADSCTALVTWLGSADTLTLGAARWSLETISGANLGTERAAWTEWWEREKAWREDELPRLAEAITGGEATQVTSAIDAILSHRVHRHEASAALRPALASPDPAAQGLACSALARLGSPRAIPWLIEKLESTNEEVRYQAWSGLRTLTKLDVPAEAPAWRIALSP